MNIVSNCDKNHLSKRCLLHKVNLYYVRECYAWQGFAHHKGGFSLQSVCAAISRHLYPKALKRHLFEAIPILNTLRSYKLRYLGLDLLAGISAGTHLIPLHEFFLV